MAEGGTEIVPSVEDDTLQGVDIGGGWLRYWDVGESAHYYFHEESGETRWVAPGEVEQEDQEDRLEKDGTDGKDLRPWPGAPSPPPSAGAGTGFGQASSNEAEWARQHDGKAFPSGAWSGLAAAAAKTTYLDPEGENAGAKYVPPAATRSTYPDGYDWDNYARFHGFRSGHEAYYQYYYPSSMQAAGVAVEHGPKAGSSNVIYEPAEGKVGVLSARDAAARLDRVLGSLPGQAAELAAEQSAGTDAGGLTEAQKIFGTAETFTPYVKPVVVEKPTDALPVAHNGPVTAEDIKASADALLEAHKLGGGPGVTAQEADIRKHGSLALKAAQDAALLAAVQGGGAGEGGYHAAATFNKRTGRFEGAGVVQKMSVNDGRRQTAHYFDQDKWTEEKNARAKRSRHLGL